jgi:hypothetical protein
MLIGSQCIQNLVPQGLRNSGPRLIPHLPKIFKDIKADLVECRMYLRCLPKHLTHPWR